MLCFAICKRNITYDIYVSNNMDSGNIFTESYMTMKIIVNAIVLLCIVPLAYFKFIALSMYFTGVL